MNPLLPGALRRTAARAPVGRLRAAQDLVRRTLASNGIGPGAGTDSGDWPRNLAATLNGALSAGHSARPATGTFGARRTFTCNAGSRDYLLDLPTSAPRGLIVMLHGCTQTPEDFSAGTAMTALAAKHDLIVVYPAQARGSNAQSCWNWFSRGDQLRGRGEPAILAGMTRAVMAEYDVPPGQIFVAGLSAGAAMAVILGETYPELYAAVGAHSGLPYSAARDVPSAFAAMSSGATPPPSRKAGHTIVPTIVFHGTADATVKPVNSQQIVDYAVSSESGELVQLVEDAPRDPDTTGRACERQITLRANGTAVAELWSVEGMGHAWSGGQVAGSYTDPSGPNASAEMLRFFLEVAGPKDRTV